MSSSLHFVEEDFVAAASMEQMPYRLRQIRLKRNETITLGTIQDLAEEIDKRFLKTDISFCLRLFLIFNTLKIFFTDKDR